ncbi:MAG: tetratricopeptide repeat protein [Gemmatimonadaceae bacterium]
MKRGAIAGSLLFVGATGCLASKSDIQLLQDEFRVTRAQLAQGDTSILRQGDARAAQIRALSSTIDRMNDSLRILSAKLANFQAVATGEFSVLGTQMSQMGERLGQTTKTAQDMKAQLDALREQGMTQPAVAAPPAATGVDTSHAMPTGPGPATLYTTAREQAKQGNYHTARSGLDQLLSTYPTYEGAPSAQLLVADTYKNEGNTTAADSVYQLVADKYPGTAEAASGLYLHAKPIWDSGKRAEARIILNKIIKDYPRSDAAGRAKALMGER